MREVNATRITACIKQMCQEAACDLPTDVLAGLEEAQTNEPYPLAQRTLGILLDNNRIASKRRVPICQDTGMVFVYIEIGQEVMIIGNLEEAIQEGVRQGYEEGYLRKSMVEEPLFERKNTQDNTPAAIYYKMVPGDAIHITIAPKGFGSENMSQLKMMKPSEGVQGVQDFVLQVVKEAGPNACPPLVVGVGIGGSFDIAPQLAKKALLRKVGSHHPDERYAQLEKQWLTQINESGIGPAGYGGKTTAIGLQIETFPTHIAGLPVAVSICCHVARHKEVTL